jgi:hypothetical protein
MEPPLRQRFKRSTHTLLSGRMRRTPYTTRRSMCAPHRARHPSAVPHCATYHTTARGRATRAGRTHRLAVRDRAALERHGAIEHAHHAAEVLRTAGAATPIAIGTAPRPPTPAPLRIAAPPRTHRCCAGYRHGVEQRGALGHVQHAAGELRTSASRRRSAAAKVRPSPDRAVHAHQTLHNGLHDRALRDGCAFATCNTRRCNTSRCNTPTRAETTRQGAPMQHATHGDVTCTSHTARRILYRMHLGGIGPLHGFGTQYASMHASFRLKTSPRGA